MAQQKRKLSKLPPIPTWLIYVVIVSVVASWLPLSLIALWRVQPSEQQRIHIFHDMGIQPRYQAQGATALFPDGRAMRQPVGGTVARGELRLDDHYYRGYRTNDDMEPVNADGEAVDPAEQQPAYFDNLPEQIELSRAFLERGRSRFTVACAPCHGEAGYGDGLVHQRTLQINATARREGRDEPAPAWVAPVDLHAVDGQGLMYGGERFPAGRMYQIISEGVRTMPAYKDQLTVEDRWAVVAYVQVLQRSQSMHIDEAPEGIAEFADPIDPVPTVPDAVEVDTAEVDMTDPQLIAQGQQLFMSKACFTCHQTDPNVPPPTAAANLNGPSFAEGFFGQERNVHIGGPQGPVETITVDEEYFVESVLQPQAKITEGYANRAMPPVPVTEEELIALMAYIRSLEPQE